LNTEQAAVTQQLPTLSLKPFFLDATMHLKLCFCLLYSSQLNFLQYSCWRKTLKHLYLYGIYSVFKHFLIIKRNFTMYSLH